MRSECFEIQDLSAYYLREKSNSQVFIFMLSFLSLFKADELLQAFNSVSRSDLPTEQQLSSSLSKTISECVKFHPHLWQYCAGEQSILSRIELKFENFVPFTNQFCQE